MDQRVVDTAPRKKDWADEDSDSDSDDAEFVRQLSPSKPVSGMNQPQHDDTPVASLASRISGLSTDTPSSSAPPPPLQSPSAAQAQSSASTTSTTTTTTRPRPNTSNALFGKALAGVVSDRSSAPSAPAQPSHQQPAPQDASGRSTSTPSKEEARMSLIDTNEGLAPTPAPASTSVPVNGEAKDRSKDTEDGDGVKRDFLDASMSDTIGLISNDFQVEVKLADLQADPNSPLYSVKSFEELPIHDDLKKGIYAVGFKKPSKIQEKALPMLLNNPPRNLIGQSQSGTGKTAAFTLNMLSRVDPALMTPQAICVAPSRELARQIQEVVDKIGQFTQIKTMLAVPGSWQRNVKIDKHILIGTPGTLVDMLSRGGRIVDPKQIRVFVLDEADEMIAMQGLGDQTSRIKRLLPPTVQNVLFSATFPDNVQDFAASFAPEANQIYLKKEEVTVDAIKQLWLECDGEDQKYNALSALYDCLAIGQSMVFCRRKATADNIAKKLTDEGHSVASLHGDKQTDERDGILDGFRNGKTKVLITTNVVARGIDIQQVNMVVNYDVPDLGPEGGYRPDVETYIHRIGRTGRFGRKGCSVIFVHDDRSRADVEAISATLGKKMKKIDARSSTDLEQLEKALKLAMKGPN